MNTFLKRMFKNSRGFSLVEAVVAVGLASVVGLGAMKLSEESVQQSSLAKQNLAMDDYIGKLRKHLTDKTNCNSVVSAGGAGLTADLSNFNSTVQPPLDIKETKVIAPSVSGGEREVVPAAIIVYFDRKISRLKNAYALKKTTAMLEYNNGAFVGCSDYEAESVISTFKMACETLGGVFSLEDGAAGSEKCDFSEMGPNHEFLVKAKKYVCEELYNGAFDGSKCDSMNMPTTPAVGGNIKQNQYLISGNWVNTFDQKCAGQNQFVSSVSSDGSVTCKTVRFCTKCDASCPASGDVCLGEISNGPGPASLNCSKDNNYTLEGSNSASGTNKCVFEKFTENSDGTACVASETETTAGLCKRYIIGTCSGAVGGAIENYEDGVSCGTNKICAGGECVEEDEDVGEDPKCEDGTVAFASKSTCESSTGEPCSEEEILVWKFPNNIIDPVDTTKHNLCKNFLRKSCASKGSVMRCTSERRSRGEEEHLPCGSQTFYCPGEEESNNKVWTLSNLSEDSCNRNVPSCDSLIGESCSGGMKECNDNPLSSSSTACQVNQVVQCEEEN